MAKIIHCGIELKVTPAQKRVFDLIAGGGKIECVKHPWKGINSNYLVDGEKVDLRVVDALRSKGVIGHEHGNIVLTKFTEYGKTLYEVALELGEEPEPYYLLMTPNIMPQELICKLWLRRHESPATERLREFLLSGVTE